MKKLLFITLILGGIVGCVILTNPILLFFSPTITKVEIIKKDTSEKLLPNSLLSHKKQIQLIKEMDPNTVGGIE
jgi:hypothetical protein